MAKFDTIIGMFKQKKSVVGLFSLMLLGGVVYYAGWHCTGIDVAYAQGSGTPSGSGTNICTAAYQVIAMFMALLSFVGFLILGLLEGLLDPELLYTSSASGGTIDGIVKSVWDVSRDITNAMLAFALIGGAILTVIKAESSVVKEYAKKFVIAVILVNFSWFFPKVALDVANVLTATVYSLPSLVSSTPCEVVSPIPSTATPPPTQPCEIFNEYRILPKTDADCNLSGQVHDYRPLICFNTIPFDNANANTGYALLNGLVMNYGRLAWLPQVVEQGGFAGVTAVSLCMSYLVSAFVSLLMIILSVFPMMGMAVVFIVRLFIIWFTMGFMPFMFIGYVAGDKLKFGNYSPMDIWNVFLQAAFIPVFVAVPISMGFIMLRALGNPSLVTFPASFNRLQTLQQPLTAGISNLIGILWVVMAGCVIWFGVFAALKSFKVTAGIVSGIEATGKNFLKFSAKAPLAAPILPGGTSALQLGGAAAKIAKDPNVIIQKDGSGYRKPGDLLKELSSGGGSGGGGGGPKLHAGEKNEYTNNLNTVVNNRGNRNDPTFAPAVRELRQTLVAKGIDPQKTEVTIEQLKKSLVELNKQTDSQALKDLRDADLEELADILKNHP